MKSAKSRKRAKGLKKYSFDAKQMIAEINDASQDQDLSEEAKLLITAGIRRYAAHNQWSSLKRFMKKLSYYSTKYK